MLDPKGGRGPAPRSGGKGSEPRSGGKGSEPRSGGKGSESPEEPLWRALAVFRLAALGYASLLVAYNFRHYEHPVVGWLVIGVMAAWSVVTISGYARPRLRAWPLLGADLAVTAACVVVSPWVLGRGGLDRGFATLPAAWIAGPVLAWAISGGRRRGAVAAILLAGCDQGMRGRITPNSLDGDVLMLLAGIAVGHVTRLAVRAQETLQRATELEAANRERERLARGIHDSVLQVLALVQRRGNEIGGAAAELGRLAGEQEAALRTLIGTGPGGSAPRDPASRDPASRNPASGDPSSGNPSSGDPDRPVDLRPLLAAGATATVSLATPAHPVLLPAAAAHEVAAAVGAALANVRQHCGPDARAWVLVESEDGAIEGGTVTVSVRDEGPGIPAGRLDEAAAAGRLGVAQSIRGRVRDLGGTVIITSAPGQGTEVELTIPYRSIS